MTNGPATLDKEMIHVLGRMELDSMRFHHEISCSEQRAQFKTYKLFISRIFHLIFSDHG